MANENTNGTLYYFTVRILIDIRFDGALVLLRVICISVSHIFYIGLEHANVRESKSKRERERVNERINAYTYIRSRTQTSNQAIKLNNLS